LIGVVVFYRRVRGKEVVGSRNEELQQQETAARAEADRPRGRMDESAGELARAEEQVSRLVTAREEVTRVPAWPAGGASR
jgi:hypothetical protein